MEERWDLWFTELYEREFDRLCRVAEHLVRNRELAEELVQDTLLLAYLKGETLRAHPAPAGWLVRTLNNLAKNALRRAEAGNLQLNEAIAIPAPPEDRGIDEVIPTGLSQEERRLLELYFVEGRRLREIGDLLGLSEDAAKQRLSRLVKKCGKLLDRDDIF